jgi:hypothetical protein
VSRDLAAISSADVVVAPDDVTRTVGAARPRRSFKAAARTCAGVGGRSGQVNTLRQLNGWSKRPASIAGVLA